MTYDVVKRQGLFVFGQINMMRIKITTGIKHIDMDQRVLIENQINKMKATNQEKSKRYYFAKFLTILIVYYYLQYHIYCLGAHTKSLPTLQCNIMVFQLIKFISSQHAFKQQPIEFIVLYCHLLIIVVREMQKKSVLIFVCIQKMS